MAEPEQQDEDTNLQAPPKLLQALRESQKYQIFVPPSVDKAVLSRAHSRLALISRRRTQWQMAKWSALAASLILAVWVARTSLSPSNSNSRLAHEDVNHDGRVDILDAFQLARQIKLGQSVPTEFDLNHDGKVDAADIELIARQAVKLEKGSRS